MARQAPAQAAPGEALVQAKNNIYAVLNNEKTLNAIQAALPDMGVTPQRVASIAFSVIAGKKQLLECDARSLVKVIIEGSLLGLSFDPHLKQAAIVPFAGQATLIVEYMGLVKLARNGGVLSHVIAAEIVYERDDFDYELGVDPRLTHKPLKRGDRGKPQGCYVVAKLKDGDVVFKYLNEAEIDFYKQKSRAKDAADSPWNTDPMAMWRKTVIRRLMGYLPMDDKSARAVSNDELLETGHDQILAPEIFEDAITVMPEKSKTEEAKEKLKAAKQTAKEESPEEAREKLQDKPAPAPEDERGDLIVAIAQLWPKLWKKVVEADMEVSAATGGKIQSLGKLESDGTLDQVKQVATHFKVLASGGPEAK